MSRVQPTLNVDNLEESIAFYSTLFNTTPAKTKPGYANFAIAEPPLKLVLIENPRQGGSINHLGVEVTDTDKVDAEQTRLHEAGFASIDERGTTCCYAKHDKFWVENAPNGERWEIYTVLEDSATFSATGDGDATCCGDQVLELAPRQASAADAVLEANSIGHRTVIRNGSRQASRDVPTKLEPSGEEPPQQREVSQRNPRCEVARERASVLAQRYRSAAICAFSPLADPQTNPGGPGGHVP